jgi:hypothetical protein
MWQVADVHYSAARLRLLSCRGSARLAATHLRGIAADLCFRGPARRAARPCSACRSDAHGARDQFASFRGSRRRLCVAARQRTTGGNPNGGIGIVSVRGEQYQATERRHSAAALLDPLSQVGDERTQRLRPASQPTRGKRRIGIYGSTNVSPISRRAMRSGVSRSAAWKRSIGSRKSSELKRKV